jgi:hypothetical protein
LILVWFILLITTLLRKQAPRQKLSSDYTNGLFCFLSRGSPPTLSFCFLLKRSRVYIFARGERRGKLTRSAVIEKERCEKRRSARVVIQHFSHLLVPLGVQTLRELLAQITHTANWILLMRFATPTNAHKRQIGFVTILKGQLYITASGGFNAVANFRCVNIELITP